MVARETCQPVAVASIGMKPDEYIKAAIRTENTPRFICISEDRFAEAWRKEHPHGAGGDNAEMMRRLREAQAQDLILSRAVHAIFGMLTELGELADIFKKHLIYGKPLDHVHIVEELGDKDWYRALFADTFKVGFEQAWTINIEKLRKRFPDKFTEELALNRDLEGERAVLEGKKDFVYNVSCTAAGYDIVIPCTPGTRLRELKARALTAVGGYYGPGQNLSDWIMLDAKDGHPLLEDRPVDELLGIKVLITTLAGHGG